MEIRWSRKRRLPDWRWWIRASGRMGAGVRFAELFRGDVDAEAAVLAALERGLPAAEALQEAGWPLAPELSLRLANGERTGTLAEAMEAVGRDLQRREEVARRLRAQLSYPMLLLLVGTGVLLLLVGVVIPRLQEVLRSLLPGGELPYWSEQIGRLYGTGLLVGLAAMLLAWIGYRAATRFARQSAGIARARERCLRRLPFFGALRFWSREARLLRQLSVLLRGGVPLPEALSLCEAGFPGQWERLALREWHRRLLMGEGFASSLHRFPLIAAENKQLLCAGQESGRLEEFMGSAATDAERRGRWRTESLLRQLEPAFLTFLTVALGGLFLAFLLPMITLFESTATGF
ncbi:MAG: hypothetical protein GVY10_11390 [Verrucomicrobia bacterium]|jgi:general secretion pathway protein F|nr:hypothetical protein [Verrucomicrobiota bacterium]